VERVNYDPPMLRHVVRERLLEADPFVLVDVGCSLGIDAAWRLFGDQLRVLAVDAQVDEIDRLARAEEHANVRYRAAIVGLADDHPFHEQRRRDAVDGGGYFDPFERTSAMAAVRRVPNPAESDFEETNLWTARTLADERITLAELLEREGFKDVDFLKTDVDGGDLEVLLSGEQALDTANVLGLMVETPFIGSPHDTTHTLHNVDRLVKRHGYLLYDLSVQRYSRTALPAPFAYRIFAGTSWGQSIWGDMVFFLDAANPGVERFRPNLSPTKLLKLACLFELFRLPDCAAELIVNRCDEFAKIADPEVLLDLLTPRLDGRKVSYREYVAAFEEAPERFYPPLPGETAAVSATPSVEAPRLRDRLRWRLVREVRKRLRLA
jgi:FkbM family methyltransferase